ncbi:type IV pilus twitching motility protein PilT [Candidatus Dojkabacteria bacterium]|nr:type IV pilus twitching motility protein PilT [Candidatus Dojkabacteria bacterium]
MPGQPVATSAVNNSSSSAKSSTKNNNGVDSSLADLAKKLSGWKSDFLGKSTKDSDTKENSVVTSTSDDKTKDISNSDSVNDNVTKPQVQPIKAAVSTLESNVDPNQDAVAKNLNVSDSSLSSPTGDQIKSVSSAGVPSSVSGVSKVQADLDALKAAENKAAESKAPVVDVNIAGADASDLGNVKPVSQPEHTSTNSDIANPPVNSVASPVVDSVTETENVAPSKTISGKYPYTIESLLEMVVQQDASDLHLTVDYPALLRVDGDLVPVDNNAIDEEIALDLILPILPENKRELLEVNREVDLAYSYADGKARFRVNAYYEKGKPAAALRLIPSRIRSIEELKLPGVFHQFTKLPHGIVLVTGPTGSGKSTTLAAMLQEINESFPKHIITIEDPIEYVYSPAKALIDQREMHEDTHSWEIALRSALRQDPDIVLVGEMRDFETIASAITLAETGHLVFATLHTNNAAQTIDRIIDVFPEHQQSQVRAQLSIIVQAVVAQRLLPIKGGGRRAVNEIMIANAAIRNLIREGKTHQIDNVIRTSLDIGMKSMDHSLVELVREGLITIEQAEDNSTNPEEVRRLMKS